LNNFIVQCGYCLDKWEILNVINEAMSGETRTLLQYFGFLSKTIDEAVDLLEWVPRYTYEFGKVTCASRMSFSYPCAFHAKSFYEEKFVASSSPFTPKYIPPMCDLCYAFDHNSDSCPQYV